MVITIILPPINPKLHAHNTGHWRTKAQHVSHLKALARIATIAETRERWERATVEYRFFVPDLVRRDEANMIHSQKAAIDGVVKAGLIPDDDWTRLHIAGVFVAVDRENPRVELRFCKVE
jgi:crossover junction endodeoxyribonuclease RusA